MECRNQQEGPMEAVLVGCTLLEAGHLLEVLSEASPTGVSVGLLRPLGNEQDLYKFWDRVPSDHSVQAEVGAKVKSNLSKEKNISVSVIDGDESASLKSNMYDIVIFGPLAFGVIDRGQGAQDANARLNIVRAAARTLRSTNGRVLFCTRELTSWQKEVFVDTKNELSESIPVLAAHPDFSSEISCEKLPISSKLAVTPELLSAVDVLLKVHSQSGFSIAPSVTLEDAARVLREACSGGTGASEGAQGYLEETAAMFVIEYSATGSGEAELPITDERMWWPKGRDGPFFNVGEHLWLKQRKEWLKNNGKRSADTAAPIPYEEVLSGLASMRRTYELPRPIRLADIIDLYLDIWESQDGY